MSRSLPHIGTTGHIFFVTIRLTGALSAEASQKLRDAYHADLSAVGLKNHRNATPAQASRLQKSYLKRLEEFLNESATNPSASKWLSADPVAQVVAEAIRFRDGSLYELHAFTIMPNHVHLLVTPRTTEKGGPPTEYLSTVVSNLKRHTARLANEILGTSGAFWDVDSLNYLVGTRAEMFRINDFILQNPVNAGLVEHWQGWRWCYTKYPPKKQLK